MRFDEFTKLRKTLIQYDYLLIDDIDERGLLNNDIKQQSLFANAIFSWTYFNPNVANIEQVISSGALRYLGNDKLKNQIGVLEFKSLGINDRQEREQEFFLNYFPPLMHQYYNFKWLNKTYVRQWEKNKHLLFIIYKVLKGKGSSRGFSQRPPEILNNQNIYSTSLKKLKLLLDRRKRDR